MDNMSVVAGLDEALEPLLRVLHASTDERGAQDIDAVRDAVAPLVADPGWLPPVYRTSVPGQVGNTQYRLAGAGDGAWCIVSVVWPGGAATPIHDHGTWGVSAQLVGHLVEVRYSRGPSGSLPLDAHGAVLCRPGDISTVTPPFDVHSVVNPMGTDAVALQVYGRDLARVDRRIFDLRTNDVRSYVTAYDEPVPG